MYMNNKNHLKKNTQKRFEFFDVTADIGFWAYGKTLNEVFENAALAMFDVITDVKKVDKNDSKAIYVESEDLVSLLYDFLEELLIIHEVDLMLFSKFDVNIIKEKYNCSEIFKLNAVINGENINWNKHDRRSEVKAITFHMMEILCDDICKARVILDL